jgi:hypothetical protein
MENCTKLFLSPQSTDTHRLVGFIYPQTNFPGILTSVQAIRGAGLNNWRGCPRQQSPSGSKISIFFEKKILISCAQQIFYYRDK